MAFSGYEGQEKKMKLLRFLLFASTLCSSLTTLSSAKEYQNFINATVKKAGFTNLFKQAEDIPMLKSASAKEKEIWNNLVKQNNELATMLANEIRRVQNHPIVINYQKTRGELWDKEALFEEKIQKLMAKKPEVREIENHLKPLKKTSETARQANYSFTKEKINPLKDKQKALIEEAYKQKYGSATVWWDWTIGQTDAFEAKVKKTKEYQDLVKQLEPLEKQAKLLEQETKPIREKIWLLMKQLKKIKISIKKSKNLPRPLKKLKEEIAMLAAKEKKLKKEHREFESNEAKKTKPATDKYQSLSMEIFNQYKKMIK